MIEFVKPHAYASRVTSFEQLNSLLRKIQFFSVALSAAGENFSMH